MITADQLLGEARYKDVDVITVTPEIISARVDGKLTNIDISANPELKNDVKNAYIPGTKVLRIAKADLRSVRAKELDPERTEAWLVVADPTFAQPTPRLLTMKQESRAMAALIPDKGQYAAGLTNEEILFAPNLCAIITQAVGDGGQSSSRNGATVRYLQLHHSTMPNADGYIQMVQSGSREVSSNFAVEGNRIIRLVNLTRRGWTSGSATMDSQSITIETANQSLAPDYKVSDASKNALAKIAKAMALDGILGAITATYIYLHKEMVGRFGVSYGTACPIDIASQDIANRANNVQLATTTQGDSDMKVIRIPDWAGRCYLTNDMGHEYINDPAAVPGLLKMSGQSAPDEVNFGNFLPAVARINLLLTNSVLGQLLATLKPKTKALGFANVSREANEKPDWVDQGLWDEAVARGAQDLLR